VAATNPYYRSTYVFVSRDSAPLAHAAAIVSAVANGDIDVVLVWGPLAGYFAHRSAPPLRIEAITPANDARWPMVFAIAVGVRRDEPALRAARPRVTPF